MRGAADHLYSSHFPSLCTVHHRHNPPNPATPPCIMRLLVYDMLVNVNGIYYVHVCEHAR